MGQIEELYKENQKLTEDLFHSRHRECQEPKEHNRSVLHGLKNEQGKYYDGVYAIFLTVFFTLSGLFIYTMEKVW